MSEKFKALIVTEKEDGTFSREIGEKEINDLPNGDVLIRVKYSSLNYKDALSASGHKGITRKYPHTPGIDAAGIVEKSNNKNFVEGDEVIVAGFDLGMNTSGGFAEFVRVSSDWVVKIPEGLNIRESMILGTAGYTAGLSLLQLEKNGLKNIKGEVLVTGATGGLGSLSVAILNKAGYKVAAATGKSDKADYLKMLGASYIIPREEVDVKSGKPLLQRKWAGVIETVGGSILETVIKQTNYYGSVAVCGNAKSSEYSSTIYPFVLRGINLLGIASADIPVEEKVIVWNNLASEWKPDILNKIYKEITLEELNDKIDLILEGKVTGRILVRL